MIIGTIFGLLFAVLAVVFLIFALKKSGAVKINGKKTFATQKDKTVATVSGVLAGVMALMLVLVPMSFHTVDTGEIAVVKHLGKAKAVRTSGTYFDLWLTEDYVKYDATVQTINISTGAYSKDAQSMDINMTVQYQINAEQGLEIAEKYGSLNTLSNRIESVSIERVKSVLSSYSAMTIIETRAVISPEVEEVIQSTISDNYFVTIVAVVLTNIDFSDEFEQTVEDKMIAEQQVLTAEYEKEKAIVAAQQQLEVARLQAQAVVAAAEADAQAVKLVAEAEAQSIALKSVEVARMLGFTITETEQEEGVSYAIDFTGKSEEEIGLISSYLRYAEYLSKWDGVLPTTYVVTDGNGASIMIPVQ